MDGVPDLSALLKGKLQLLNRLQSILRDRLTPEAMVLLKVVEPSEKGPPKKEPPERGPHLQSIKGSERRLLVQIPRRRKRAKRLRGERPTRFLPKSLLPSMRLPRVRRPKRRRMGGKGLVAGKLSLPIEARA